MSNLPGDKPAGRTLALLGLVLALGLSGCGDDPVEWTLVWSDEFDGSTVNTANWTFETGDGCPNLCGWGNQELEYYRAENATVADGFLTIFAREEAFETRAYTSARMVSRDKAEFTYGKFEARIKLPIGRGLWSAFWLLGGNIGEVGWPESGEIDIMENLGQEPSLVHGTVHGPGYSGGGGVGRNTQLSGAIFHSDFHVFAVEWEPDGITWLLDDKPFQTVTPATLPPGTRWVFDHPFFVVINLAVGGNWPGPPDGTTSFPQEMVVDWVHIYQREP